MGRFDVFKLRSAVMEREDGFANPGDWLLPVPGADQDGFTGALLKAVGERL